MLDFAVVGTRQSPIEAKLIKDGRALPLKEVEIVVHDDTVEMRYKKPARNLSGGYQVQLSNKQGETTQDVFINMQGLRLVTKAEFVSSEKGVKRAEQFTPGQCSAMHPYGT